MQTSEVYDKECGKCRERKKISVNCEFVGFENGRLNYKCKECKKSWAKVTNESTKNDQLWWLRQWNCIQWK